MRQVATALIAMTCLSVLPCTVAHAQGQPTYTITFKNQSGVNIKVKGYTVVNGSQRAGPVVELKKSGGMAFESNVPTGVRLYTIYDANQPIAKVLLRDHPVPIQNRNVTLTIIASPTPQNPNRLIILAE